MGNITHSNLDDVFSYHKPKNDFQIEKYHRIRQAAKECAKVMLDTTEEAPRLAALEKLTDQLRAETGQCRDQGEALALLEAACAFACGLVAKLGGAAAAGVPDGGPEWDAETTHAVIQCIRSAVMWANASVALEGRI